MKETAKKIAFIRGLMEGMNLDTASGESKILAQMLDVLDLMSDEIAELVDAHNELVDQVDDIDEDLEALEDEVYDDDNDYDDDDDDDFYDDEDDDVVVCPECGKEFSFDEVINEEGDLECPSCGAAITFGCDMDCDECPDAEDCEGKE